MVMLEGVLSGKSPTNQSLCQSKAKSVDSFLCSTIVERLIGTAPATKAAQDAVAEVLKR